MAAIIQFPGGTQATLDGETWHCPNASVQTLCRLTAEMLPASYRPAPERDLATEVAAEIGAVLIHADPTRDDAPAGAEY